MIGFLFVKIYVDSNMYIKFNEISSNRLRNWTVSWQQCMSNGVEWKLLFGSGIVETEDSQAIVLADGRVEKKFKRFAIDNLYIEFIILNGLLGCMIFIFGFYKFLNWGLMYRWLKRKKYSYKFKRVLSIAYGSIMGILLGGFFNSHFPSLGNTLNSFVFPFSIATIYLMKAQMKNEPQGLQSQNKNV